ncbi:MAG: hypothetical protein KR126chlam3_00568 [Chlamydiae bacterium]|nr:hypothetical protein [Chlamydiota bacterium]
MVQNFEFPEDATPISDCSDLIPTWVETFKDLNRVEAENISLAQRKYFRRPIGDPSQWFQVKELLTIHRAMFGNVWRWAGRFRKSITSIGIQPNLIPNHLAELCNEVVSWFHHPVELTFLEKSAFIHHRLVSIHPFENGNGRFSRLVADRFLLALRCPHPIWPNHLQRDGIARKEYIQALKNADKGDYEPLISFMKEFGACDPQVSEFFTNRFYRNFLKRDIGVAILIALLRRGGNPNETTPKGYRVLHLAVKSGLKEIVKLLIDSGAEIDAKDRNGLTPFQTAVMMENTILADFLVSCGAHKA